mmetsp:Transcript_7540/g.22027  ORF Transcript_7540/g.22027 Transcript_7540/m.22027 type:complete len:286 (+) Transcript_7540:393-1250(+)
MERRPTVDVCRVDVCAERDEGGDALDHPRRREVAELVRRRRAAREQLGPRGVQHRRNLAGVAGAKRVGERRRSPAVETGGVGARAEQHAHAGKVTLGGRDVQRRALVVVVRISGGAALEHESKQRCLARLHQLAQLGCGADTLERELPSGGAQRRGDVVMAVPNRLTQRRHARRVLRRRIRSPLEQRPHGWHTAKGCSHVQRGPSVEVPRVGVGANLERQAEGHRLPAVSERLQLRRRGEPVGAERPSARVEQASEPGVRRTHRLVEGREAAAIDGVDAGAALQQ